MEYIFEDFFAGFLVERFNKHWEIEYQKSEKYLATNEAGRNAFNMQHDIFLTSRETPGLNIIVDTKYKLRDLDFKNDLKKGIAQGDLCKMVSYAFTRGCTEIMLVYPNLAEEINSPDKFEIRSGFFPYEKINVTAIEIPFWSMTNFESLATELEKVVSESLLGIQRNSQR